MALTTAQMHVGNYKNFWSEHERIFGKKIKVKPVVTNDKKKDVYENNKS